MEDLDEVAQTFRIGSLNIGYANSQLEDFEDGNVLTDEDEVEVRARFS